VLSHEGRHAILDATTDTLPHGGVRVALRLVHAFDDARVAAVAQEVELERGLAVGRVGLRVERAPCLGELHKLGRLLLREEPVQRHRPPRLEDVV